MPGTPTRSAGAYGLALTGIHSSLLADVPAGLPELEVTCETRSAHGREQYLASDRAEIELLDGAWVSVHRDGRAHFTLPRPLGTDEIVHPWLVPAAATFNAWHGRQILHGGALSVDGNGLIVVGHKEDGKSSLLAWIAQTSAADVLADDLAVIERGTVFAGPRCIDLRPGSVQALRNAGHLRLVRDGSRHRLALASCPPMARLRGIVVLAWSSGHELEITPLSTQEGFAALLPHTLRAGCDSSLFELLGVPVWCLRRPKTWSAMPETAEQLLSLIPRSERAPTDGPSASPAAIPAL